MRITQGMYYKNLYGTNGTQLNNKLFDVNKQISSGLKMQYANENVAAFTETMRLDNEIVTLDQITTSTKSGYKVSNQTDVVLNEFDASILRMRTLLLQAANGTHNEISLDAIAKELRGQESHLKNLANTSINGQYLFSGSAVDVKPISSDGRYNGNDTKMSSFLGSHSKQQYNISGAELFLGEEKGIRKEITSNVVQTLNAPKAHDSKLSGSSTMSEFMGDSPGGNHYFYARGIQSNGEAFNQKIVIANHETVDDLLTHIGNAYGNTNTNRVVNVSLNPSGQIVIDDRLKGSSKLDFHMVGATDFSGAGNANVAHIDSLDTGDTDYATAFSSSSLYVREFVKSGFTQSDSVSSTANNIEGLIYDRTKFSVSGNRVYSNAVQVEKTTNAFATPSTKLSEVADISKGTLDTADDTLVGETLSLTGKNVTGNDFTVNINLSANSTFSVIAPLADAGVYDIFDVGSPRAAVHADEMTYQQLMDVLNMVVTNNIPSTFSTDTDYDTAVKNANFAGSTAISYDGKIEFQDLNFITTKAEISLHDSKSGDFSNTIDSDGDTVVDSAASSFMTFNTNNALTIKDPKTDFFKTMDEIITSVENYKLYPDHTTGGQRVVGIQNAIKMIDDLQEHFFTAHSQVGANSNALNSSIERTETLKLSTQTLRSQVIDTDIAEAALTLTQLTLNYEAMLSTVGRVSKLSLVNYL